jgi:osmotically-inducible protein OsmY
MMLSVLTACASTMLTGANVYYERHDLQKKLLAFELDHQIAQSIKTNPRFNRDHIRVVIFEETALLVGQAHDEPTKKLAENIVKENVGDYRILNFITTTQPINLLAQTKDTWISTKLKTKIIATNQLQASNLKVVTEDQTVYLMGIARPEQEEIVNYLAHETNGVKRVISLLEEIAPRQIKQDIINQELHV